MRVGGGYADAWLTSMEQATQCLHVPPPQDRASSDHAMEILDDSIMYLQTLQVVLNSVAPSTWHLEPRQAPPLQNTSIVPSQVVMTSSNLGYDDDDDEAGDQPVLPPETMNVLRILIRLGTYIADLWARKGSMLAHEHAWTDGAQALHGSLMQMRTSLELADGQISKYFQEEEEEDGNLFHSRRTNRKRDLQEDADIVHVAAQSLLMQREKYVSAANRQIRKIQRILQPQWKSRDAVKNRWGKERWENNPAPKHDFSQLRAESEAELKQLKQAMESLQAIDALQDSVQVLKGRLSSGTKSKRYNGARPRSDVNRVAGFPDATDYGWLFTGSDHHVEFFERPVDFDDGNGTVLVKLDFYFTTGTVKTSMDHPTGGKTQLFASKERITPEIYIEILLNPRSHTNIRYHTTATNG